MNPAQADVCFVFPGKLGGVASIVANLLAHRQPDALTYSAILTNNRLDVDTRFDGELMADRQAWFHHLLPVENLYAVLARLRRVVPPAPGVLIANDWIELALASRFDTGRMVVQILHGDHDYYYDLARRHEPVIDIYIAYSRAMYDNLRTLLPERHDSIHHLPYGIPLPARVRQPARGPLRLLFAGRLEHGQKGVFDLLLIDGRLREAAVNVRWTIVGDGPHAAELRQRWTDASHVAWLGRRDNAEVLALCAEHDLFVLPTRAEGFPVALLEAMGAGLVPVVSNLASGIPEIVEPGVTGYRPEIGDIDGFAQAIIELAHDRERLEAMSKAARQVVVERFDIRERVVAYQKLFARWQELKRPRPAHVTVPYGSRLDRAWLPNGLVYPIRKAMRWLTGKRC